MSSKTIPTAEYVKFLEKKYIGLTVPSYKLKEFFSTTSKVFFNCKNKDKKSCLREALEKSGYPSFRVYLVVKDVDTDKHCFMDICFRNLSGKETLEHFIERYRKQLQSMTKLSLQGAGEIYIDCVGHSYEETTPQDCLRKL